MCDQAPAALVNDVVVTELSTDSARRIVRELRKHGDPARLVTRVGDGNNAHPLVRAMVHNNIRQAGPIIFSPCNRGEAIRKSPGDYARRGHPGAEDVAATRPRRGRFPRRDESGNSRARPPASRNTSSATRTKASRERSRTACC